MTYVPIKSTDGLWAFSSYDELMADITNLNHVVLALGIGGLILLAGCVHSQVHNEAIDGDGGHSGKDRHGRPRGPRA